MTSPDDRAFALYRSTGDAAALAMVFDRTAPKLLLLASHWTRDPAAAEDLVQVTFVQALRDAAQWDDRQPLLGWLAGILAHRALDLKKRAGRRAHADIDAMELPGREPSPLDAAMDGEVLERVAAAVDGLDEPYRSVLVLRLVHGMEPFAIAHALGRPPATVRKQLERGLQQLRAALPASIALPLAGILATGRGLAAVRVAVLSACDSGLPIAAAAAVTAGGVLVMNKVLMAVVGVALALTAVMLWSQTGTSANAPKASALPGQPAPVAVGRTDGPPLERTLAVLDAESQPWPATSADAEMVMPRAELEVSVRDRLDRAVEEMHVTVTVHAARPRHERGITDDRGCWAAALPCEGPATVTLQNGDTKPAQLRLGAHAKVDFVLGDSAAVSGRVVDAAGTPVTGAVVYLAPPSTVQWKVNPTATAMTDAGGRYALRHVAWRSLIGARARGFQASALYQVKQAAAVGADLVIDIVLQTGGGSIRGQVIDAIGSPIADATILVTTPIQSRFGHAGDIPTQQWDRTLTTSDSFGRFAVDGQPEGSATITAWSVDRPRTVQEITVPASRSVDVVLRLFEGGELSGVVRTATGEPVADARIQGGNGWPEDEVLPVSRTDANGRYHLAGLPETKISVRASAADLLSGSTTVAIAAGQRAVFDFTLEPAPRIEGTVVDSHGRPQVGVWVWAREPGTRSPMSPRQQTDADGRFALPCTTAGKARIYLRWDDAIVEAIADVVHCPASGLVLLHDPAAVAGASLRGGLFDSEQPLANAGLMLRLDGPEKILRRAGETRRDGSFELGPLPAGTYTLVVHRPWERTSTVEFGPFVLAAGEPRDVGALRLAPRDTK